MGSAGAPMVSTLLGSVSAGEGCARCWWRRCPRHQWQRLGDGGGDTKIKKQGCTFKLRMHSSKLWPHDWDKGECFNYGKLGTLLVIVDCWGWSQEQVDKYNWEWFRDYAFKWSTCSLMHDLETCVLDLGKSSLIWGMLHTFETMLMTTLVKCIVEITPIVASLTLEI